MWRVQLYVTQPCLHTLMQTRLSANQSARTILVILYIYITIIHHGVGESDGYLLYLAASRLGKYSPLFTSTSMNNR